MQSTRRHQVSLLSKPTTPLPLRLRQGAQEGIKPSSMSRSQIPLAVTGLPLSTARGREQRVRRARKQRRRLAAAQTKAQGKPSLPARDTKHIFPPPPNLLTLPPRPTEPCGSQLCHALAWSQSDGSHSTAVHTCVYLKTGFQNPSEIKQ